MNKQKKPVWVPGRAWEEYLSSKANTHLRAMFDDRSPIVKMGNSFEKMIFEKRCESVWKLIYSGSLDLPVLRLLLAVTHALKGVTAASVVPKSVRKERGEEIAKLAARLRDALLSASTEGEVPESLLYPASEKIFDALHRHVPVVLGQEQMQHGQEEIEKMRCDRATNDLLFKSGDLNLLHAIETGAKTWASSEPVEYRPNGKIEHRNFFIGWMGRFFKEHFQKPCVKQIAALVYCFFEEDLADKRIRDILSDSEQRLPPKVLDLPILEG